MKAIIDVDEKWPIFNLTPLFGLDIQQCGQFPGLIDVDEEFVHKYVIITSDYIALQVKLRALYEIQQQEMLFKNGRQDPDSI